MIFMSLSFYVICFFPFKTQLKGVITFLDVGDLPKYICQIQGVSKRYEAVKITSNSHIQLSSCSLKNETYFAHFPIIMMRLDQLDEIWTKIYFKSGSLTCRISHELQIL